MMERPIFGIPIFSRTQKIPFIRYPRSVDMGPIKNVLSCVNSIGYQILL